MRIPSSISLRAAPCGAMRPSGPSGSPAPLSSWSAPSTRNPSCSSSLTTAERSPSSPSTRRPTRAKTLAARQSGRSEAIDGRRTPPASTSSLTSLARKRSRPFPAAPSRHQACGTPATASGSASPSSARTNTSRPDAWQLSIRRRGKVPLPATIPILAAIRSFRLTDRPARIGTDEIENVVHRADPAETLGRIVDPVAQSAVLGKQELIGGAQPLDILPAVAAALDADDVETAQTGPVAHDLAIGDDIALDARHAADHRVPPDPDELMDGTEAA